MDWYIRGVAMGPDAVLLRLMRQGCVDAFDLMLGQKVQQGAGCWLGVFVSRAFRQGHMAVQIGDEIRPSVKGLFSDDGMVVVDAQMERHIESCLRQEVATSCGQLVVEGATVALPRAHAVEVCLAGQIQRLQEAVPFVQVNEIHVEEPVNESQKAAVIGASSAAFCLVTGGPGTGKTYTAGVFLRSLVRASPETMLRVALVAPTGRAVQTLKSGIQKMSGSGVAIEAKTIHSLVAGGGGTFLPYHVVIVDEGSMIGSDLMLSLLERLASRTRVMILGDADQLPSVDPGQPFFEMLKVVEKRFSLDSCLRTTSRELLELAACVRRGNCQEFERLLESTEGDVSFVECVTDDDWKRGEAIVDSEVMAPWRRELSLDEATQLLRTSTLLTPCKSGYWGAESVNHRMGQQRECMPVVCSKNSYHLGVMNGDVGVLQRGYPCDQIHFHHCTIPSVLVPKMERAFAMTVHKSQGGEFDTVVVVIPPRALLDRRLLYTAITRAKRRLIIIGQKKDLMDAVERCEERVSTLSSRLQAMARAYR